jgi:TolA-binding protein
MVGHAVEVDPDGRLLFDLGSDRVGVDAETRIEVVRADTRVTRLRLERGRAAFRVEPRDEAGTFVVEASGHLVEVVGTCFGVTVVGPNDLEVEVHEGTVRIAGPHGPGELVKHERKWSGRAGETASRGDLDAAGIEAIEELLSLPDEAEEAERVKEQPTPDAEVAADPADEGALERPRSSRVPAPARDMETWRDLVVDGRYAEANKALRVHLERHPNDTEAWSLLAGCLRKEEKWEASVRAYRRAARPGGTAEASRAVYVAATILQDRLGRGDEAARLLEQFLTEDRSPRSLRAEALFRLARIERQRGNLERARALLGEVVEQHQGTTAAIRARRMLDEIE